ncbi:hypothetical protein [Herpetosiphon sp. NSE202]|uniref:hypothetical protein n=1 Tax=Herpetosiphon sp. NSE202 TaxID=3351349 RepID=UPI00363EBA9C
MTIDDLETRLESFVSRAQIVRDTRRILEEGAVNGMIAVELEDDQFTPVPQDTPITVIQTTFECFYVGDVFGPVKAIVALGAMTIQEGVILPQYCFVRLYYNEEGTVFTTDFYRD